MPRYFSPRVQATIDALGLVEVALPFWCSGWWRVAVPVGGVVSSVRRGKGGMWPGGRGSACGGPGYVRFTFCVEDRV